MKSFSIQEAIQFLETTPGVLNALLRNLPEGWADSREGPDTWSPYDIVGHLNHGEKTDWIPRMQMILEEGTAKPFPEFDRQAQFRDSKGKSLSQLLDQFEELRKKNIGKLKQQELSESDFSKTGLHPDLGEVTLQQLLATWVVHDLGHLRQIARVLAKQYKEEIGPLAEYLPVVSE